MVCVASEEDVPPIPATSNQPCSKPGEDLLLRSEMSSLQAPRQGRQSARHGKPCPSTESRPNR